MRTVTIARCATRVLAMILVICSVDRVLAQTRYIDGVFVATPQGPIELLAYAEPTGTGRLSLNGDFEDIPTLRPGCRVLVSLPAWRAAGALVATANIFDNELAERRDLKSLVRSFNIYAAEMEFTELPKPGYVAKMVKMVKASEENPAYVFVILTNGPARTRSAFTRFYPLRLDPSEPGRSIGEPCGPTQ